MDDLVKQILEKEYHLKINQRIGRGGFAEVFAAQTAEGIPCAIKVSLDLLDGTSPAVQKELENLRLIRSLTGHPNLVTLMDVWVISDYLVTRWELASDGSLEELLRRYQSQGQSSIPLQELFRYIWDAAQAVDFLNAQGVYHRDIKPANLLLFYGHVKLGDLGLAKLAGASTASHTGSGTLGYLAPEAYNQHRLCPTADLYSLAATYLRLRTGREPFGSNPAEVVQRQVAGDPILDGLSPAEAECVKAALAAKPEDRPQDGAVRWVRRLAETFKRKKPDASVAREANAAEAPAQRPAQTPAQEPTPLAGSSPSALAAVVRVDPSGQGDVRTLEEAVVCVAPGGTVRLAAGTHQVSKPLLLERPMSLEGEWMDRTRVVGGGEEYLIKFVGEGLFTATGITFEHRGEAIADVVVISSGAVVLDCCRFKGAVSDQKSARGGCGLRLGGTTRGTVKGCAAVHNHCGILVDYRAEPTLQKNTCSENGKCGIAYLGSASGTARANRCTNNKFHGIYVAGQSQPTLEKNTCSENGECGIAYLGSASGVARGNQCTNNKLHGIYVGGQAQPTLEKNTCNENADCGIAYFASASGVARGNQCTNNKVHGIYVAEQAKPTLEKNTCSENKCNGIAYFGSASGVARGNQCTNNKLHGIYVGEQAQPALEENTCSENGKCGIAYFDSASGTARGNRCVNNNKHGIYAGGQAQPTLEENTCSENGKCGIAYLDSASGTARKNVCTKNGGNGIYADQAQPMLEENTCSNNSRRVISCVIWGAMCLGSTGMRMAHTIFSGGTGGAIGGAILGAIVGATLGAIYGIWVVNPKQ